MSKTVMNGIARKLTRFFGSSLFFYIVLGFFIFEALWFVFSAIYPMPFDEDFHFGIIKIYATQWSPWLTQHPAGADQFGAVTRDPSYFFHYLMSFPYRIVAEFTGNQTAQVIVLRLINTALFAAGLVMFRKVMLRAKASAPFANIALALFVLVPIVPQLAGHINYDNLLMLMLPLMCLSVFDITEGLKRRRLEAKPILYFVSNVLFMSIVKYAALPFVVAAVLFLGIMFVHYFRGHFKGVWRNAWRSLIAIEKRQRIALLALALIGFVLFLQRYAVNLALYRSPVPDCAQVLTVQQCSAYGPWGRDYYLAQEKPDDFSANPLVYMKTWIEGMWFRLFFAVNGATSNFTNYIPLPIPGRTAIVVGMAGFILSAFYWRRIFGNNVYLIFFALLIVIYSLILWVEEYGMYRETGQPVAINGRYLLPVLLPLAVIMGKAFQAALRKLPAVKPYAATAVILLFLYGGGVFTFILRSDNTWYWQNNTVIKANNAAQKVLSPLILEGRK